MFYFKKQNTSYEGEWLENAANGWGTVIYDENEFYQGYFENNKKNGLGTFQRKVNGIIE